MTRVTMNGAREIVGDSVHNMGQLIEELERRCGTRGEVMTALRCDGVDRPAFRGTALSSQPVAGFGLVEVETMRPRELLLSVVDEAAAALVALELAAKRLGQAFRGFDVATANRELAEFAESLMFLVTLTNDVATAVSADLSVAGHDGTVPIALIDHLSLQTESVISAQQACDWISLADVIEYDIGLTLRRWPALLGSLREHVSASSLTAGKPRAREIP